MTRITLLREQRGWSKAELARRAGLHPSQVGQFEAGRLVPYAGQLGKLAQALDWPLGKAEGLLDEVQATR
jgi:transcriptional regulator with XRE-family HTH domain